MADKVETMASYTVPWHGKGRRLPVEVVDSETAIEYGGVGWAVSMRPVYLSTGEKIKNRKALVRSTDKAVFQIFTDKYSPLQNRDAFKFFDGIVGEGRAIYHTVGSLNGGRQVWILAKLPGEIRVLGDDVTEKYLLLMNSHDGSTQIMTTFTGVQVVCQNTLNMALKDGQRTIKIKHLGNYTKRFTDAAQLMGIATKHYDILQEVAELMASARITADQLLKYTEQLLPLPPVPTDTAVEVVAWYETVRKHVEADRAKMLELAETGACATLARGTIWGALGSATEFLDHHYKNYRNDNNQLRDIWFGGVANKTQMAWDLAVELLN